MLLFRPILALLPVLTVVACAATGPAVDGTPQPGADATVQLTPSLMFSPTPVTIPVGGTVSFENISAFVHTVSTRPDSPEEAAATELPAGAASFDAGEVQPGAIWTHTFEVPGTYRYFCEPHQGVGMTGTIVVTG